MAREKEIAEAFTPTAPVDREDLFAGRVRQLRTLMEAVQGRGEHAVIYGERGVGKTSLAAVGALLVSRPNEVLAAKVNCAEHDGFEAIWRKVFAHLDVVQTHRPIGFEGATRTETVNAADRLPAEPTSHDIEILLLELAEVTELAIFIDEFDRIRDKTAHAKMADLIKALSDRGAPVTVVLVGVADDVSSLIDEHQSIERGLTQVQMPRMSPPELRDIIERGLKKLGMTIEEAGLDRIAGLSQGLPHYTHLLASEAARAALWDEDAQDHISRQHVLAAMRRAVDRSPELLKKRYHRATSSPRQRTLYPDVLVAAALVEGDNLGYFSPKDVRDPMSRVAGRAIDITTFSPHLHKLCEADRGSVLERTGSPRRYRFRFANPLLQPYVLLRALADGELKETVVSEFLG